MRTAGHEHALIRSAIRCSGALSRWASSTRRCRRASTDSPATVVDPDHQGAARRCGFRPVTGSPGPRSTGRGSPVSIDSSTGDHPDTTVPSRGVASPGRTSDQRPHRDALGGDQLASRRRGPCTTRAVGGRRESSECMAAAAARARGPGLDGPPGRPGWPR